MPPNGHALLSASSSERWLNCTPSARLCENYEDKGSDYAAEGTDAHTLCEYKLRKALGMEATDPTENLTWFNQEMNECVNDYVAYILELVEAAKIDGATKLQALFKVTIPMVMSSVTICLFLTLTNSFKLFDQNLALTAGAPSKKTAMLALDIYNTFYGRNGYEGVGQAKAVLFFIVVAVIALGQLVLTRRKEVEQ